MNQFMDGGRGVILDVHVDGGFGVFVTTDNNVRVFNVKQLPLQYAASMTLHGYLVYVKTAYLEGFD